MAGNMLPLGPPKSRGYPKLAALMGSHQETAIFRRFGMLNMLNLLSLQAELTDFEVQLESIIQEDETSGDTNRMLHAIDFRELRAYAKEGDDLHWQMLLDIRAKLQEYSITLRLHMRSRPVKADINARCSYPPSRASVET